MSAQSVQETDAEISQINWEKLNKTLRNRKLSLIMVKEFDQGSGCDQSMDDLFHSIMEMDYSRIWLKAYDITNSLGYIAADSCLDISKKLRDIAKENEENNSERKDPEQVKELVVLYLRLIEAYKRLKVYIASQNQSCPDLETLELHRSKTLKKYMEKPKVEASQANEKAFKGRCKGKANTCNIF